MNNSLYSKKVVCPICGKQFSSMKAKINSCKVKKRDEDFCIHYMDLNPMYYDIFVCPCCAYAAPENTFRELTEEEAGILKEAFSGRKVGRSFCSERSLDDAIAAYKLAIYTAELRKASAGTLAGLCLKLAWLFRFKGDKQEELFLGYSLRNYLEAFNKEPLPIGNLNEISLMYLIGELSRRLGKLNEAITWFGKAVVSPERKENPKIEKLAREQWALTRSQHMESEKNE
ncbi:MAG: DUF2225 domain-containing protein [Gracilibacteraceae bacterium]|jgi:uncharacterized protein (DUF2225 family)|nr:DUF2225 domain-containing protein [Gracilibacteraceae bacterium]